MPENRLFPPEGLTLHTPYTIATLKAAQKEQTILEAPVLRCDTAHSLHLSLGEMRGIMYREEVVAPWISGSQRDIAVLSRVGKTVCFQILEIQTDVKGAPIAILSRKSAQEQALHYFESQLTPGMILTCRITHMETYGVFLDIGCGIIAMLPIERISISRLSHPKDRFYVGQKILAAVLAIDRNTHRITMTHRELLGTWMENASYFEPGETVQGIVRSVKEYGSFIELSPNLSGLADPQNNIAPGDVVSVYIKSIHPERMKIKLQIIEKIITAEEKSKTLPLSYQITDGILDEWIYSPPNYGKPPLKTVFKVSDL